MAAKISKEIAFGDGRRLKRDAVVTLALGPGALRKLGLPADALEIFPAAFLDGMNAEGRDRILGDFGPNHRKHWWWGNGDTPPDAALLIYGRDDECVEALCEKIQKICAAPHKVAHHIPLLEIPKKRADRKEPFGFVDGISQPIVRGTYRSLRNPDTIHLVEPGEIILGYPDNRENIPPGPQLNALHDPENRLPIAEDTEGFSHNIVNAPRDIGRNGSFLVLRQLEQDANGFRDYCECEADRLKDRLDEPYHITDEFIGAKLVGRWKDGSSIMRFPYRSASELKKEPPELQPKLMSRSQTQPKEGTPTQAAPAVDGDNDFLFGTEDPQGLRCPFGAHIRRANPRDSLSPGSADQIEISSRHRILRVGRGYKPEADHRGGLLFMCLNGDIERQFEFVQQTWLASQVFHGLDAEVDPLVCDGRDGANGFTVPTRDGPMRLKAMQQFVTTRGGGYFFLPGKRLVEYLAE